MKWLGAALLVFAGGVAGFGKTAAIRRQIALLEEVITFILHIRTELRQRGTPLPDILETYPAECLPLAVWTEQLRKGRSVLQAAEPWLNTLDPEAGRVLFDLCGTLGRYDGETQALACEHAVGLLALQTDELRRQLQEKGRLYHTVPLTLGLMAALALF